VTNLFVPAAICLLVPLLILSSQMKGAVTRPGSVDEPHASALSRAQKNVVFFSALVILILVPVVKTLTHLPPYMGMLLGLGILWLLTEVLHGTKDPVHRHRYSVSYALQKVDTPSILFF